MVVITLQIVSSISKAHVFNGGRDYPFPYNHVARFFDVLSLDLFQLFALDCVDRMDFETELHWATLLPLSLLLAAFLFRGARVVIEAKPLLQGYAVKGALILIYIAL